MNLETIKQLESLIKKVISDDKNFGGGGGK